jgi:inhibitor of cysteine peptidase
VNHTRHPIVFLLVLLSILFLVACGGGSGVAVGKAQNGGSVELETGSVLEVRLESNPSTGYSWQVVDLNGEVLVQKGDAEYKSASVQPKLGSGGVEIFHFKASQPGEVVLKLVYHRPWETDVEPADTFELAVMVK